MAYSISSTLKSLNDQISKEMMIILKIEGSQYLYGSAPILETARWDDPRITWDNEIGVTWDGEIEKANSKPYIMPLKSRTTKQLTQQLLVDKGGSGSVATMNIELVDYRGEVARDLSFDQIGEPLGKKATIYMGLKGGRYPQDFVQIMKGYIDDLKYGAGSITVSVALATNLIRQASYEQYQAQLTAEAKFKTFTASNIRFNQIALTISTTASIEIVDTGSLSASLVGSDLTINIDAGVTTAEEVVDLVANSSAINGYIETILVGAGDTIVSTLAQTSVETDTTLQMSTVGNLLQTQDALTSYIRIEDEIMEVVGVDENNNTIDVIRERLNTIAASHEALSDTTSYYILSDHPIDLALKMLLSKDGNEFTDTEYRISALNRINTTTLIDGAIVVNDYDIEVSSGATIGDFIEISGSASNDGIYPITGFGTIDTGKSYFLTDTNTLSEETGLDLVVRLKSKYNVLPDGAGLAIDFVDTNTFEEIKATYSADFVDYSFKLKDTIEDTKEWLIKEIMAPSSLYVIPRKGKTSCKKTVPPFSVDPIPTLNTENLYDITKVEMRRSTHKYLLNQVVFRYGEGTLEDKFFAKYIKSNADSFSRIGVGRKRLAIESKGYSRTPEALQTIDRISTNILNRYRFGARYIRNVKVLLTVGLQLEIGDIVFFGGEDTQLVNLQTGERNLPPNQYEIINKKLDISKGETILELLEVSFGIDGIFGTFSLSSQVLAGSTVDKLLIGEIWDSSQYEKERDKWDRWIGLKVRVRSEDYTYDETATLDRYDSTTINGLILDPPLPSAPPEGAFVELAKYTEYTSDELESIMKLTHTFTMPQGVITSVTDDKTFDLADVTDFEVGMEINVHSDDYTIDSETRIIDDITGNTITLNEDLDISPAIDHLMEVYKYAEEKGYRYL